MFPAYGCLVALQQGCATDRAMCNEGQKWDKGNIVPLEAFWTIDVSSPKEKQGWINHRELQAGPQSAAQSQEIQTMLESGKARCIFCYKHPNHLVNQSWKMLFVSKAKEVWVEKKHLN